MTELDADDAPVTFHIKSSQDAKYTVTIPLSHTVQQLKEKLSTSEYADLPPERQRLIYSGRVLKDPDTLASYKIKEGNTVHLVKGAASNQRQNPAASGSGAAATGQASPAVPTNLSSGPGANNPLAGLTGARYAGLAHLPNQSMFGPDGGMGPPPDPEQILQLLENPQFASTLNEALSNPQIVETMIQQNPMLREMGPEMRQMMQSPEFRRIMTDPQMLRSTMQMQRAFGGNPFGPRGAGGNSAFPAPGATDTTPSGAQASDAGEGQGQSQGSGQQGQQQPMNPFAVFNSAQGANPFAQMFNPAAFGGAAGQGQGQAGGGSNAGTGTGTGTGQQSGANPSASPNPFFNPQLMAQMLNNMSAAQAQAAQQQQQQNRGASGGTATASNAASEDPASSAPGAGSGSPTAANAQQQQPANPFAALLAMMDPSGAGNNSGSTSAAGAATNPYAAFNPFTFPGVFGGGFGAEGGAGMGHAPPQQDTRPPEERYAEQLRQLNDMGFYEFERNVEALRRSGGSVQGAVEYLLSQPAP